MKRVVLTSIVFFAFAVLVGCGTSNKPTASKITISPTATSIATGGTIQFKVVQSDNPYPAVTWAVSSVPNGSLTVGTIDYSGLYIAPGTVPSPAKVTITATLISDQTQTASAEVTITAGTPVAITISPTTASVPATQTQRFTATVSNTANTNVIWEVNDVSGGDSVHGIIDQSGMFAAPASPPTPTTVTVKAIAQADSTKSATATVTITPFTFISVLPSVVPAMPAGHQQQFTAKLNGQNIDVTWNLSCNSQAAGACGTVSADGVYTAPLSPPPGGDVSVIASAADPQIHSGGAMVTVQFSNASLTGKYALSFSGKDATGPYTAAGSITFDGTANVSGGELDIHNSTVTHVAVTGGTYNVGTDGRGVATINTSSGTHNWRVVAVNHRQAYVIPSDTTGAIGSGTLDVQDAAAFAASSINGEHAFKVAGPNANNAATFAMAGALSADGAGHITAGTLDINNAGDVKSALALTPTSYTAPSSSGRGALTLTSSFGAQDFVYYVVDAHHIKLLSVDAARAAIGELTKQSAGPFTTASFHGGYAFLLAGSSGGHPSASGGVFQLDGAGNMTSGTLDTNSNGNIQTAGMAGTYAVSNATAGRTTVAVTANGAALHYVVYPQVDGLYLLGADATDVSAGVALAQGDSSFTTGAITGNYALSLAGADLSVHPGEEAVLGRIIPNGGTAMTGVLDINDNVEAHTTVALDAAGYHVDANGHGTATLPTTVAPFTSASFTVYVVDADRILWLESDPNRVLTGVMKKQY